MPPADSTPRVVDAITRFATDPRAIAALRTSLTRMAEEAPGRVEAQSAFFHALGGDGAEAVADALRIWIPVSQRGVAHGEGRIRFMRTL
jgi:hypothetical protein